MNGHQKTKSYSSPITYRPDIDGLRAIAVMAVILFHAEVPGFTGGYVGVDIFFVISGYLITSLIYKAINSGTFSLMEFYNRRIRRIFPALFFLLWSCTVVAITLLPEHELFNFSKSLIATSFFGSNVYFNSISGYFDAPAHTKPLLHTWSLAVEEQYYIVFPLLILLLTRYSRRIGAVFLLVTGVSLIASSVRVEVNPDSAFYLAHYRAWEFLLGALAALGVFPKPEKLVTQSMALIFGLGMIFYSVFLYSEYTLFPGISALAPCVGALLIILSGHSGGSVSAILAWRPLVFTGLISYSLYLWHWPLLVYGRVLWPEGIPPLGVIAIILLAYVFAAFSWRFVEQPFRGKNAVIESRHDLFSTAGLVVAVTILIGVISFQRTADAEKHTAKETIPGVEHYLLGSCFLEQSQSIKKWQGLEQCSFGARQHPVVLFWGDSYIAHFTPGLMELSEKIPFKVVSFSAQACPPVFGADIAWAPLCKSVNSDFKEVLTLVNPDLVVLGARWGRYWNSFLDLEAVLKTSTIIQSLGYPTLLIGQGPTFLFEDPRKIFLREGRSEATVKDVDYINTSLATINNTYFYIPGKEDCVGRKCKFHTDEGYLYWDSGHYSKLGSTRYTIGLVHYIESILQDMRAKENK